MRDGALFISFSLFIEKHALFVVKMKVRFLIAFEDGVVGNNAWNIRGPAMR